MDVTLLSIDVDGLERISEDEVPYKKRTKWDEIFESIPKGQAVVIHEEMAHPSSIRQALTRRKKLGQFTELKMITRGSSGRRTTYIINPK